MIFKETNLKGTFIIEPEKLQDERGFFSRAWCTKEFQRHGLNPNWVQCNISFNRRKGTLRGMHYQAPPFSEAKLVRCTMGAIYSVAIDLRYASETFMQWQAIELSAKNRQMIYVPEGFAFGFQSLLDNTEVFYQMSQFYAPEYARGVRWDDPAFAIRWPLQVSVISERDSHYLYSVLEKEIADEY